MLIGRVFKRIAGRSAGGQALTKNWFSTSQISCMRIDETNPVKHTNEHLGLFYTVPVADRAKLFPAGGLPKSFLSSVDTFNEMCLMIRKPALDVINYLEKTDFDKPVIRYVLFGKPGCGKTLTLAHIVHYAYLNQFVLVHVPWTWTWFRDKKVDAAYSTSHAGMVDLPVVSANWLKHFQTQNENLLKNLDLKIGKDYVWNQREVTTEGSSIHELILHGINRIKYAADCVDALISELKAASNAKKCKTLVVIDGFNALLGGSPTVVKTEDKLMVNPANVTLSQTMINACKQDWTNGAVVLTIDQRAAKNNFLNNHFPLYLLGRKGFETLDPFVPVPVTELTESEFHNMVDYYEDRKWIFRKDGRVDLEFLTNKNPYKLREMCGGL
ncbi:28S ribosomal protein S29, mitochondrial [Cimex lectularius]|uniref:Small ribosomal subunit protein mS29 n=1 Tax=Cimex lectularius TaxID=79782 RepID=A0A8I6TEL5_CIMLE|nr:28S ribosomal protein S29, mitochondrial [Cimex lectularius]